MKNLQTIFKPELQTIENYKLLVRKNTHMPFMNKSLTSAHMKRSRLRNLYLKDKTETSRIAYIKQRNYCVSLLRKLNKIITLI